MPGSTPATSQLDWLISTTAMIVLSWSKATRDLLKSFGWGIRALHQLVAATMVPSPRRLPHTISPLEEAGFEPSVPLYILTVSDPLLVGPVTVPFAKRKSPVGDRVPSVRRLLPPRPSPMQTLATHLGSCACYRRVVSTRLSAQAVARESR